MNRNRTWLALGLTTILALGMALPVLGQDATETPNASDTMGQSGAFVNCDSSLILLAGLAQRYFGYVPSAEMNLGSFEYGQYSSLFDMGMGGISSGASDSGTSGNMTGGGQGATTGSNTGGADSTGSNAIQELTATPVGGGTPGTTTGAEASTTTGGEEATMDASGIDSSGGTTESTDQAVMTGTGMYLNPPMLTDEDPMCTQLRTNIEAFFAQQFATNDWDQRFRGGMGSSGNTGDGAGAGGGG